MPARRFERISRRPRRADAVVKRARGAFAARSLDAGLARSSETIVGAVRARDLVDTSARDGALATRAPRVPRGEGEKRREAREGPGGRDRAERRDMRAFALTLAIAAFCCSRIFSSSALCIFFCSRRRAFSALARAILDGDMMPPSSSSSSDSSGSALAS